MEVYEVAKKIEQRINMLTEGRKQLLEAAKMKAYTIGEYRRKLAITIIKLKNGVRMELDGNFIANPTATITLEVARGICWQEKLDMEQAEAQYKAVITGIQAVEAELNGYQSINRYLREV